MSKEYTITRIDNELWEVSQDDKSFNIHKTPETYITDGHYFVSVEELINILTEIRLSDELANSQSALV